MMIDVCTIGRHFIVTSRVFYYYIQTRVLMSIKLYYDLNQTRNDSRNMIE
jgi:hypothetical protein